MNYYVYYLLDPGTGNLLYIGRSHRPETRAKIAAANIGKKQSPETIAKRLASIAANRV